MRARFDSIYSHGFIRGAVCIPALRVADPEFNLERTLALARQASNANVAVALFPELGLSAYSNDDLFHQTALLDASQAAVAQLVQSSRALTPVLVVGAPRVRREAVQLRGGDSPRAVAGSGTQDLPAQLPRVATFI